jgi:hypothetical protein
MARVSGISRGSILNVNPEIFTIYFLKLAPIPYSKGKGVSFQ